jgi:cysteine peptidase B
MKAVIVLALFVCAAVALTPPYYDQFLAFKTKYNKKYTSQEVERRRYHIFVENMNKAQKMNEKNPHATFGANEYADLSAEEFKTYHNGVEFYKKATAKFANTKVENLYNADQVKAAVQKIDWRTKGAVTHVKNQGQCGSCWAFSTTGGVEGQWMLAGNKLTSLSEQNLVSCDTTDSGCNGGLMNTAYEWLLGNQNGQLVTEATYPYVSGDGFAPACNMTGTKWGAQIHGHYDIAHAEDQMMTWVGMNGPLSIAVDATAWQVYNSGIMTDCGGYQLDHGVLIVGFDLEHNPQYWIVKNSWGQSWGENGYIRVQYGNDQCLMTHYPVTSVIKATASPGPTTFPSGTYMYTECDDSACSVGCNTWFFKQNQCISWDGVSFTASCSGSAVQMNTYTTLNCTGTSTPVTQPTNQCAQDDDFTYYTNACPSKQANIQSYTIIENKNKPKKLIQRIKAMRKH